MEPTNDTTEQEASVPEQSGSKIGRLANELEKTNDIMKNAFSLRMIIIRGLLTGVAIVVGSTIVVSITVSGLRYIVGDDIPFIPSSFTDE